jgi:alcohol dehydrogenase class IV
MTSTWSFPTRIKFGVGCVDDLAAEMRGLGGSSAFLVSDRGVVAAGIAQTVTQVLSEESMNVTLFDGISSNPTEAELIEATTAFTDSGAEVIIGLGGGSPLDVAKLVRVLATHEGPIARFDDAAGGSELITEDLPPMIAIPTTAGTGSEVGRSGVVTVESTGIKTVIFAPNLIPNVALLDPALTTSMPPLTTAATGFDALTHCIEAYCAAATHPMADAIAVSGMRLAAENLVAAVEDGSDLKARGEMMMAATMGAVAFQKGLGVCHSLAHPLSAECGLHHGLANAICLPAVLDFNRSAIPGRIAMIASILGVKGEDEETLAFECAGAVRALRRKVGLPSSLSEAEVDEDLLPTLADLAHQDACHSLNPRACTAEDMLALYRACM